MVFAQAKTSTTAATYLCNYSTFHIGSTKISWYYCLTDGDINHASRKWTCSEHISDHFVSSPKTQLFAHSRRYSAPDRGEKYCDESVCLSVCVCLSAIISSELHVRSSPNVLCMLPMAGVRSSSGGVVIRYVFPVLWMTSFAHKPRLLHVAAQLKRSASAWL